MAWLAYRHHMEPGRHDGANRDAIERIARLAAHRPLDDEHSRLWRQGTLADRRPMTLVASSGDSMTAPELYQRRADGASRHSRSAGGLGRLVTSVAADPKSPIVLAGFDEGQVIVCALSRREKVVPLRWPDWERITALAWSHDGAHLTAGTEGAISLVDVSTGPSL